VPKQTITAEQRSRRFSTGSAVLLSSLALLGLAGCAGPEENAKSDNGGAPAEGNANEPAKGTAATGSTKDQNGQKILAPVVPAKTADKASSPAAKTPANGQVAGGPGAKAPGPVGPASGKPLDPPGDEQPGGQGGRGSGDPRMDDFQKEMSLAEQERKVLSQSYLKTGRSLSMELRYRAALPYYKRAADLDPNSTEARVEYEKCAWIVGDRQRGEYKDAVREIANERLARMKQAKIEMERLFSEGEILVEKQRYDDAVQRFERVLEAIRWFPYEIDPGQAYLKKTQEAISRARALQSAQEARRREALQEAAKQQSEFEKTERVKYVEATLKQLLKEAQDAYNNSRFDKCIKFCDEILEKRPDDVKAHKLRDDAEGESARDFEIKVYKDKVEHYRRQLEWINSSKVPYQEIFMFPDADAWADIARREVLQYQQFNVAALNEDTAEIQRRLDSQKINLNFDDTPFADAIDTLHELTSINFVIHTAAKDLIDNEQLKVKLKVKDITVRNALNLIMAAKEGELIYVVKNGVILITTKAGEKKQLFLEFYDVSDIINQIPDFPAPELGLPGNKSGGGGQAGMAGATLTFTDDKKANQGVGVDADKLRDLVDSKIGEAADDGGSVDISGGVLIVRKSADAHKKIQRLLEALRRTVGIMVTVESRFVDVQDNYLEEIGVDLINQPDQPQYPPPGYPPDTFGSINRPLSTTSGPTDVQVGYNFTSRSGDFNQRAAFLNSLSTPLGTAAGNPFNITNTGGISLQWNYLHNFQMQAILSAVKKKQKARQINAPRVQAFNGQRAHLLSIVQRAYIQGVEVNQTGVIPVLNPVVGILNTGSILDVRPTVSYDKKYVTLEVRPTLAVEGATRHPPPITLANGNTSIPIELPVIIIQKIRSTVTVPDGGTVLIGGLKNFEEQYMEEGVPFLVDMPVIKNLFRRQGFDDLKRSLVVLLKCQITVIRDEEVQTFGRKPEKQQ
jgi:general secretion pathway protein D